MTLDFKNYLATEILSEQRTVSYRTVARALQVHVNAAKCMLYEFQQFQAERKPQSVYATYLVAGTKKPQKKALSNGKSNGTKHSDADPPPSSPPAPASSMPEPSPSQQADGEESHLGERHTVPVKAVTLVREENLEAVKDQYETITSIHVYSLSPARILDLAALTDVGRGLYADAFSKEDPLAANKKYGVIQNPKARRRTGKRPVVSQAPPPKFQPVKPEPKSTTKGTPAQTEPKTSTPIQEANQPKKEETPASRPSSRDSTSSSATKPTLKRDASALFKAFAKAKSKPAEKAQPDPDTPMPDADSEGESEDEALFLDTGTRQPAKKRVSDVQKERADKAAKLRKMMDSDDDEDEKEQAAAAAAEPTAAKVEKAAETENPPETAQKGAEADEDDGGAVAWSDSDTEKPTAKGAPADDASSKVDEGPKRRRGKRRVMKKRTMKDEEGYLVTKEEAVWESYSEDEPEAKKPAASAPTPSASAKKEPPKSSAPAGVKGVKPAPKKTGNIMSFFGKKP